MLVSVGWSLQTLSYLVMSQACNYNYNDNLQEIFFLFCLHNDFSTHVLCSFNGSCNNNYIEAPLLITTVAAITIKLLAPYVICYMS